MIVALTTCFSANAQSFIIPKIGLTVSSIGFSEDVKNDLSPRTSLQMGLAFDLGVTSSFSIQPELLYVQKGNKEVKSVKVLNVTTTTTDYLKMNYLEIPVLAKIKFGNDQTEFYITTGPSLGVAISGEQKRVVASSLIPSSTSEKIQFGTGDDALFKRFDLGWQLGIGAVLHGFTIDVRYGSSVITIFNDPDNDLDLKAYNRALGITVGYAFPIGK